jgi:hypothetical protein
MMHVRYPLSLRNVEDLLLERGSDICHGLKPGWVWASCAQPETSCRWTDTTPHKRGVAGERPVPPVGRVRVASWPKWLASGHPPVVTESCDMPRETVPTPAIFRAKAGIALIAAALAIASSTAIAEEPFHYELLPPIICKLQHINEDGTGGGIICTQNGVPVGAMAAQCIAKKGRLVERENGRFACRVPARVLDRNPDRNPIAPSKK